jgi:hypothetical protein
MPETMDTMNSGSAQEHTLNTATDNSVLTSSDGNFMCAADMAVEDAYLLNVAEAAIFKSPKDKWEIGRVLAEYCDGQLTHAEALEALNDDISGD